MGFQYKKNKPKWRRKPKWLKRRHHKEMLRDTYWQRKIQKLEE